MHNPILSDNLKIILESIDLIEERFSKINLADDFVTSSEGVLLLDAVSMRLQVIGETVKKIRVTNEHLCFSDHTEPAILKTIAAGEKSIQDKDAR